MDVNKNMEKTPSNNFKLVNKFLFPKSESSNKSAKKKTFVSKVNVQPKYNRIDKKINNEFSKHLIHDKTARIYDKMKHENMLKSNENTFIKEGNKKNLGLPIKDLSNTKVKKMSNSVKDEPKYQTETSFFPSQTFTKFNFKPISSLKNKINETTVSHIPNKSSFCEKDKTYLLTEDKHTNFSNYQKLTKTTTKRNTDITNNISNTDSIFNNVYNKRNSLNMSFLNQFVEKRNSPIHSLRKNVLNDSFEKYISSFSLHFPQLKTNQNTPLPESKSESPNPSNKISRNFYEVKEQNFDENYVKNTLLSSAGKVLSVELINKIFNDIPEVYNKKSSTSTKEDTLKIFNSNNYQTKNLEIDSIEYLHFLFVQFFQKSKQIMSNQENKRIIQKAINNSTERNVIKLEEVDIE